MPRGKDLTTTELAEIKSYLKEGYNYEDIGELVGRNKKSIQNIVFRYKLKSDMAIVTPKSEAKKAEQSAPQKTIVVSEPVMVSKEKTLDDFPKRQIIKYLYDAGYRWDNMYCMVKQKVNINDIIANG